MRTIMAIAAGATIGAASGGALAAGERSDRVHLGRVPVQATAQPATAVQQAMLAEKLAIADRLMQAAVEGREVTVDYRMWLLESMYRAPLSELRAIAAGSGPDAIVRAVTKAAKAPQKLGAASTELVYYPITPCRYIDTRNVGGPLTHLAASISRAPATRYGGSAACDPKAAVGGNEDTIGALAINVAIVSPTTAPGFVGVRPAGAVNTSALVNWYAAGANVQASNAGVVTTNQAPATATRSSSSAARPSSSSTLRRVRRADRDRARLHERHRDQCRRRHGHPRLQPVRGTPARPATRWCRTPAKPVRVAHSKVARWYSPVKARSSGAPTASATTPGRPRRRSTTRRGAAASRAARTDERPRHDHRDMAASRWRRPPRCLPPPVASPAGGATVIDDARGRRSRPRCGPTSTRGCASPRRSSPRSRGAPTPRRSRSPTSSGCARASTA